MMKLEDALRENLEIAADSLVVPDPKPARTQAETPPRRSGLKVALAGAVVVLALAVPALLWQGTGPADEMAATPPTLAPFSASSAVPTTSAPTTTVVADTITTDVTSTLAPDDQARQAIGELQVGDERVVVEVERVDLEEPPTATTRLVLVGADGSETQDEIIVGPTAGFFWRVLIGQDGLCELATEAVDGGADVTIQLLLSPSSGCSEPYVVALRSGDLRLLEAPPEQVAEGFVAAWQMGDEATMSDLAEPEALEQAETVEQGFDIASLSLVICDGAAGSVYCTWEEEEGDLIVRVRSQAPTAVIEVYTEPAP